MDVTAYLARRRWSRYPQEGGGREAYRDGGIDNLDVSLLDQDFSGLETELLDLFFGDGFAALELSDLAMWGQRSWKVKRESWEEDRSRSLGMTSGRQSMARQQARCNRAPDPFHLTHINCSSSVLFTSLSNHPAAGLVRASCGHREPCASNSLGR